MRGEGSEDLRNARRGDSSTIVYRGGVGCDELLELCQACPLPTVPLMPRPLPTPQGLGDAQGGRGGALKTLKNTKI